MFRCTDCPAIRPRTFTKRGHFENHLRKVHPQAWTAYDLKKGQRMRQDIHLVRSDEDAIRAFRDLQQSMSAPEFRSMMSNPTQSNIPVDAFCSRAPIDTDFVREETSSGHIGMESESTEQETPHSSESMEDMETPCDPDAGAAAFGPLDPYDEWWYHDMNRRVPPPFQALSHYNFAEWLIRHQVSKEAINELLHPDANMPLYDNLRQSFTSYHTLHGALSRMNEHNNLAAWQEIKLSSKWPNSDDDVVVFKRNPGDLVRMLIGQKTYNEHMSYAPVIRTVAEYDDDNGIRRVRAYKDMNSAEWWEETQVCNSKNGFPCKHPMFGLINTSNGL